jgi:nucleotide-binding universal stress UspA family protein
MEDRLLHVFRNTPLGRETFLQSLYFCKTLGVIPHVYIPESTQFLMYFQNDAVQVDLDGSYLTSPQTALSHAAGLAEQSGITPVYLMPKNFTASKLPDIPTAFNYMCCPRTISDISAKIGLGYIGPKVRRIVKSSTFPVLITSPVFKPWKSITVFYGGSQNANKALRWGLHLNRQSGYPLDMFTFNKDQDADYFSQQLQAADLLESVQRHVRTWHQVSEGSFEENLYAVDHDALLVVGAYGHGIIKDFLFGSKMEAIQTWMTNNILLVGPNCIFGAAG